MTKEAIREIQKELAVVLEKYGIRDSAFCGVGEEGHFIGGMVGSGGEISRESTIKTALNIGRLWQHTRETVRNVLDSFEK